MRRLSAVLVIVIVILFDTSYAKSKTFDDVLKFSEDEYNETISNIAVVSITECGDTEPDSCYKYVSLNVLNRLVIVRHNYKKASALKVISEPKQYSGWWDGKRKRSCLSPAMYARNIKRAIDNAAEAIGSDVTEAYGTCYLNPKVVKKMYGKLPSWATDKKGRLKKGKFIGTHYFIEENLGFYYNGVYITQ